MAADSASSFVPGLSRQATIPAMLAETVARCGDRPALGFFQQGRLQWLAWNEIVQAVAEGTAALAAAGVGPEDRVAHWGGNSPGWIVADLAIQSRGAVHVPLHAALPLAAAVEQIVHSDARLALAQDVRHADQLRERLPRGFAVAERDSFLASGRSAPPVAPALIEPDSLATILYTSGTTGAPRGVMLTHRQLTSNVIATSDASAQPADEVRLCVLPMSHIYARTCDLYSWVYRGTRIVLAESRDTLVRDAGACQPTVMNAVPYLYQKLAQAVRERPADQRGAALRQLLGGSIKRLHCGGAAMSPDVERIFEEAGLPIFTGYGLTESAPVVSTTTAETYVAGTVGRPLANIEVMIADDSEVLVRGPSVMSGYWRDESATAETLADGWLHTGDLGAWSPGGNLVITGRKKEMLVLATGKNVAPARLEALLVGSPLVEQACLVGDGRNYLVALIVPNPSALREEIRRQRLWVWSRRRAVGHPRVRALYRAEIERCLADTAPHERIGEFVLLARGFSVEEGEMTPKLSLRRDAIELRFSREIARMYERR